MYCIAIAHIRNAHGQQSVEKACQPRGAVCTAQDQEPTNMGRTTPCVCWSEWDQHMLHMIIKSLVWASLVVPVSLVKPVSLGLVIGKFKNPLMKSLSSVYMGYIPD